ncbi:MAG: hypothetical protein ACI9S8_002563 [Chlamydiales bacterium]|jgi:hypothetical protein
MKSERLKKMEMELRDLEQWLKLGLVPKKDTARHKEEIKVTQSKIADERDRLKFLKETTSDEIEYAIPKKASRSAGYADGQNLPDIDTGNDTAAAGLTDVTTFDSDTEVAEVETAVTDITSTEDDVTVVEEEDEDPFSDSNRWKRGIADPDSEDW